MSALLPADLPEIAAFGECMLEVSGGLGTSAKLSFGGDTLNTSVYLARLGIRTSYVTALGADPLSDDLLQAWKDEGLDCQWVLRSPDHLPGMYAIRTDEHGERRFFYWRSDSAARQFFKLPAAHGILVDLAQVPRLYVSGITLSIFDNAARRQIVELASRIKENGGEIMFDPNYRAHGWRNSEDARAAFSSIGPHVTVVLPTYEDERALWGDADPGETIERWRAWGASEVVVKSGPDGAVVYASATSLDVPVPDRIAPLDTTGAGDSFNAAYIAARIKGLPAVAAALAGHRLAAEVICHSGAIIPLQAMPEPSESARI